MKVRLAVRDEREERRAERVKRVTGLYMFPLHRERGTTYPKATTTPPFSVTTDCLQPGHCLFSLSIAGSGML